MVVLIEIVVALVPGICGDFGTLVSVGDTLSVDIDSLDDSYNVGIGRVTRTLSSSTPLLFCFLVSTIVYIW